MTSTTGINAAKDQPHSLELSIVIPCLNEAETIERCVAVAVKCLADNKIDGEILVGDNVNHPFVFERSGND